MFCCGKLISSSAPQASLSSHHLPGQRVKELLDCSRRTLLIHLSLTQSEIDADFVLRKCTNSLHSFCRYLSTSHDIEVLIRGARLLGAILRQTPLVEMLDDIDGEEPAGLLNHDLASKSHAALEALIRERVETLYHPACTARMAPREDGGVVDPFLRVHGAEGLRLCDASVFPTITSGHTVSAFVSKNSIKRGHDLGPQASPTIAVAEKAAEMILRDLIGEY